MAEFVDVMKQAKRMCGEHNECGGCALREMADKADIYCPIQTMRKLDAAKVEASVMDWAANNPEPKYPTWKEWHKANFPDSRDCVAPCNFMSCDSVERLYNIDCNHAKCSDCADRNIPADIAKRLGIKPIEVK